MNGGERVLHAEATTAFTAGFSADLTYKRKLAGSRSPRQNLTGPPRLHLVCAAALALAVRAGPQTISPFHFTEDRTMRQKWLTLLALAGVVCSNSLALAKVPDFDVPELGLGSLVGAVTLVAGGLLVFAGRRPRA